MKDLIIRIHARMFGWVGFTEDAPQVTANVVEQEGVADPFKRLE
jgi:hypothetical protein